ncbi:hypothetical protein X564_09210 [Pseudoalteromonas agarivorans]|nr:hypothetical protein X564_09210 [Pseudoalteromonas agarivorans]
MYLNKNKFSFIYLKHKKSDNRQSAIAFSVGLLRLNTNSLN